MEQLEFLLMVLMAAMLLGGTIGSALGIPAIFRLRKAKVLVYSITGAIVGTFVGILLAWWAFHTQSGNSFGGGLLWMWFVLPSIVSVTAISVGELAIFIFERSQRRH